MMFRKYITLAEAKERWPDVLEYPSINEQMESLNAPQYVKDMLKVNIKKTMMELAEKAIDDELSISKTQ